MLRWCVAGLVPTLHNARMSKLRPGEEREASAAAAAAPAISMSVTGDHDSSTVLNDCPNASVTNNDHSTHEHTHHPQKSDT